MKSSFMLTLIRKQAFEECETDPVVIRALIQKQYAIEGQRVSLLKEYNYVGKNHSHHNNRSSALRSKGCGCRECVTRNTYARSKVAISHFKKTYSCDEHHHLFISLYIKERLSNESEKEFYERKVEELKTESKNLKTIHRSVVDTIQHLLSMERRIDSGS